MPVTRRAGEGTPGASAAPAARTRASGPGQDAAARRVMVAATVLGLASRGYLLTRHGFLTSGTIEYDDGVYLGAATRLLDGTLPYRDFAFIQPPGILIVALPAALIGMVTRASAGLAVARLMTVCASAACVPLAGNLVRHRGTLVTLVTCGFLAVYPADVMTARTLLLEPWMNLCCLLAANAAFQRGKLASPRRLGWAGVALGFAGSVKFWAAFPAAVLLGLCLAVRERRVQRTRACLAALTAGFAVTAGPFAAGAPLAFFRDTVLVQATRSGTPVPLPARLDYLTGLIDVLNRHGSLTTTELSRSIFATAANAVTVTEARGWVPYAVAVIGFGVVAFGYLLRPAQRSQLEWYALAVAAAASAAILGYPAFFYHYPAFPAPWLALAAGGAAGALARPAARAAARLGRAPGPDFGQLAGRAAIAVVAVAVLAVAALQAREVTGESAPASPPVASVVPPGACLFTDQVSFAIAADRFGPAEPGCPDILDSLAATLVLGHGVSAQGGAGNDPRVTAGWESVLGSARYVWLSDADQQRIPWTAGLRAWFAAHFRLVAVYHAYNDSRLYERSS